MPRKVWVEITSMVKFRNGLTIYPILYNQGNYLSMLGLKLIKLCERGHCWHDFPFQNYITYILYQWNFRNDPFWIPNYNLNEAIIIKLIGNISLYNIHSIMLYSIVNLRLRKVTLAKRLKASWLLYYSSCVPHYWPKRYYVAANAAIWLKP